MDADVLIGEPVGSCTDLSATILQPLKDKFGGRFALSPLSVLADPRRLAEVLSDGAGALHASAAYIFRKQLEEADLLIVNKIDTVSPGEREDSSGSSASSSRRLGCVFCLPRRAKAWKRGLTKCSRIAWRATRILDVDYDVYAEGEAVLGWLNADIQLSAVADQVGWDALCSDLLNALHAEFREKRARIGHVKLLLTAGGGHCVGNLTGLNCEPVVQGRIEGSPRRADLILNARVEMSPRGVGANRTRCSGEDCRPACADRDPELAVSASRPPPAHASLQDGGGVLRQRCLGHSGFELRICFGFRISCFGFSPRGLLHPRPGLLDVQPAVRGDLELDVHGEIGVPGRM